MRATLKLNKRLKFSHQANIVDNVNFSLQLSLASFVSTKNIPNNLTHISFSNKKSKKKFFIFLPFPSCVYTLFLGNFYFSEFCVDPLISI